MGWGRFLLLGDLGQQLDLRDQQQAMEHMRASVEGQRSRDDRQDVKIRELAAENVELKLALNRLATLLVHKGVISADDLRTIVGELERAEAAPGGGAQNFQKPR
jgi:multidrug resistance efflux pump